MNAQALLKQLDFVGQVVVKDPIVPILACVLVDNGHLISSNLRTSLMCRTEIEGMFAFPLQAVRKVVSILPKDADVQMSYDEAAQRVTMVAASGTFIFNDIPNAGDFPKLPTRQETEIGRLNSLDLHRIYSALSFTSNDELRPAMTGVYINKQIVSTDGHRLAWFDYSGIVKEGALLVDKLTASVLCQFGQADIRYDGEATVEFHNNKGKSIIARLIEERYVDYKNAIPTEHTTCVTISKEALLVGLNLGIQMANKTTRQIIFDFDSANGALLTTKDLDFDTKFQYPIPCVVEGNNLQIAFDGVYMKSILSAIDSEEVTIKLGKANRAGIINDSFMLMPIMIADHLWS